MEIERSIDWREYVHQELNQEVIAIGGRYVLVKEERLPFRGREVLYLVGQAAFDTSCCGVGGCAYALVPGFVLDWKAATNREGLVVSRVEPIHDGALQKEIEGAISRREVIQQVRFL
jgi:hypothetical protein